MKLGKTNVNPFSNISITENGTDGHSTRRAGQNQHVINKLIYFYPTNNGNTIRRQRATKSKIRSISELSRNVIKFSKFSFSSNF